MSWIVGVRAGRCLVVSAVWLAVSGPATAATLLGSGTLNTPDDLTRIDDDGIVLEFLDVSLTANQTISEAEAAYASDGFAFATDDQVAALLDAFGTAYQFAPFAFVDLEASAASVDSFVSYLGITGIASLGSFGWFDTTGAGGNPNTYLCMSTNCTPNSFVNNDLSPPIDVIGVFLVRAAIPEPGTLSLLALGAVAIAAARRRRSRVDALGRAFR